MSYELTLDAGSGVAKLAGELGIYTVAELRTRLQEMLGVVDTIEVDLSGVTEIDTAGLQLMLLAKRQDGKTVRFSNHSAAVIKLVDLANLGKMLGDPMFIGAAE